MSECKFFNTPGGCRYGSSCHFLHRREQSSQRPSRPAPPSSLRTIGAQREEAKGEAKATGLASRVPESIDELWNFQDMKIGDSSHVNPSFPNNAYAEALQKNLDPNYQPPVAAPSEPKAIDPSLLCRFFVAGNCKFGSRCRYIHALPTTDGSVEMADAAPYRPPEPVECGICFDAAPGSVYGLMSHCNCKFCLTCIREWRKDGIQVARDSQQVRLCPLCRTQSYFVIPSREHVTGEAKDKLVDAYKTSLAKKPCKHYHSNNKECPFGASCFYMHEPDGSKGVQVTKRNAGRRSVNLFERLQRQLLEDYLDSNFALGFNRDYDSDLDYDMDDEFFFDDEDGWFDDDED
jgi:hypothetical protein